eukprot:623763-Pyramimonas_sp.AAC.1
MKQWKALARSLSWMGAPAILIRLVTQLYLEPSINMSPTLDSVEYFAGDQQYTRAKARDGRIAVGFEIKDDPVMMDFLNPVGFLYAVSLCCRLKPGGQCVSAPVCSTWVWLSRGSTGRTKRRPLGNQLLKCVRDGNCMVSRLCLLMFIMYAKGVFFIIEQPANSLLEEHPKFKLFRKHFTLYRKSISMINYGGDSRKPTWLYSAHKEIMDLDQYAPTSPAPSSKNKKVEMVVKGTDKNGNVTVTGGKNLKESQSYPRQFGESLSKLFKANENSFRREAHARALAANNQDVPIQECFEAASAKHWSDARLAPGLKVLQQGTFKS